MPSIYKDLVEYKGIYKCKDSNFENFKQCNYEFTFDIPCEKPDILDITIVEGTVSIIKEEVVKTMRGTSLEGQIATGHKLAICGDIDYKIQYTTAKDVQIFHTINPFGVYVALPKEYNNHSYATASVVVEDILVKKINSRCIYSNITMLLVANTDC